MEEFYGQNVCFVTGATGFVGKVLVEKLLRWQPHGPPLYLLIRPRQDESAQDRLHREIVSSPIFTRLIKEIGQEQFDAVVARRLRAVEGDLLKQNLGLAPHTYARLKREVSVVLHIAASVDFNADLATAMMINVVAALEMQRISIDWECIAHVHVSTCYVNANRVLPNQKFVREKIYELDFDPEVVMNEVIENFGPASGNARNSFLLEAYQAKIMGNYPNTYTLTKSIAENLLVKRRPSQESLVILRPSIIGASWREPVPGWVDNVSAAGAVFMAAGLGLLKIIPGNMRGISDIVPVDTVVNYILVAGLSIANTHRLQVVHSSTSANENCVRWRIASKNVIDYFKLARPKAQLRTPSFKLIGNSQTFEAEWLARYQLPAFAFKLFANVMGTSKLVKQSAKIDWVIARCQQIVGLFRHFTCHEWIFQSDVLPEWIKQHPGAVPFAGPLRSPENDGPPPISFDLSTEEIVWPQYLRDFSYGLNFYVLKEDIYPIEHRSDATTSLAAQSSRILDWDADHHSISYPGLFKDAWWIYTSNRQAGYFDGTLVGKLMKLTGWQQHKIYPLNRNIRSFSDPSTRVLLHANVQRAIEARALDDMNPKASKKAKKGRWSAPATKAAAVSRVKEEAREMVAQIAASDGDRNQRMLGYVVRKVLRNLFEEIIVDFKGITRVRSLVEEDQAPVVLLPTHRSYIDFLLVSYIFFTFSVDIPFIAAAEDFLGLGFVTNMLRDSRAFFLKRGGFDDELYATVFSEYVADILDQRHSVEFFIEGTRSRSGKQLAPKKGLLKSIVSNYCSGKVKDVVFVPVVIDYEKVMELGAYAAEMLGYQKRKESLKELVTAAASVMRSNYGTVAINFSKEISLKDFVEKMRETDADITPEDVAVRLQHVVTSRLVGQTLCMPTHIVATLLLTFRQGLTLTELQSQFDWAYAMIKARGGVVLCVETQRRDNVIRRAIKLLGELVTEQRKDFFRPTIFQRQSCVNSLSLAYLKNKLFPVFFSEAKVACVVQLRHQNAEAASTLDKTNAQSDTPCSVEDILDEYLFLGALLQHESALQTDLTRAGASREISASLERLQGAKSPQSTPKQLLFFLNMYLWPFIESYWATTVAILTMPSTGFHEETGREGLLRRIQWFAETMYNDNEMLFYESCSVHTIGFAVKYLVDSNIFAAVRGNNISDAVAALNGSALNQSADKSMGEVYAFDEQKLKQLRDKISLFRRKRTSEFGANAHRLDLRGSLKPNFRGSLTAAPGGAKL